MQNKKAISHKNTKQTTDKIPSTMMEIKEATELLSFLLESLKNKSRNDVKNLLKNKQVLVDSHAISQFNHPLEKGSKVQILWKKPIENIKYSGLTIVFEDEYLIVIEKDAGLLSIATEKQKDKTAYSILSSHVKRQNPSNRIFIVHRLDRDTSGLMMFAKSEKIQQLLQENWGESIDERTYLALVEGMVEQESGTITSFLLESKARVVYSNHQSEEGQKAITHYKVLQKNKKYSLLEVSLETGRKNQIRVHAKDIGHCVVGDKKYGATSDPIKRLGLHAWVLAFKHPITKLDLRFETPILPKFLSVF